MTQFVSDLHWSICNVYLFQATELFIMYLTKLSQRHGDNDAVDYQDLAAIVQRKESMEFLHDIVPKKIKFEEYLKMMEAIGEKEDDEGF